MKVIKHILGKYDMQSGKQYCLICDKAIVDHTHAISSDGNFPSWAEGEFYEAGKNTTVMFSELPNDYLLPGDKLINCNEE